MDSQEQLNKNYSNHHSEEAAAVDEGPISDAWRQLVPSIHQTQEANKDAIVPAFPPHVSFMGKNQLPSLVILQIHTGDKPPTTVILPVHLPFQPFPQSCGLSVFKHESKM